MNDLPFEVLFTYQIILSVVPFLDVSAFSNLRLTSKRMNQILNLDTSFERLLKGCYGKSVLYYTFERHFSLFDRRPQLIFRLVRAGCTVPRFLGQVTQTLIQICFRNTIASRSKVCKAIVENCSFSMDGDDINQFEYLSNHIDVSFGNIRELIDEYGFIPSPRLTPSASFRLLKMAAKDFEFVRRLVIDRGMMIDEVNDSVLVMLLSNFSANEKELLLDLVRLGFQLTPAIIQGQLKKLSPELLEALLQIVPLHVLEDCAIQVLSKMFGHDGSFDPDIASHLISVFELSDECVKSMFLNDGSKGLIGTYPYKTRCFEQLMAIEVWNWVFEGYGPTHEFTEACFEDLLHWMTLASPFQIESLNPHNIVTVFMTIWKSNTELLQPRHLEFVGRLLETPVWITFVNQVVSEIRSNIQLQFREDLDYVWVWCIHLKQTLKLLQNRSKIRTQIDAKEVLLELEFAIEDCMNILHGNNDSKGKGPKIQLVKFYTSDGNVRFVEKRDTHLLRRFDSLETKRPRTAWFWRSRDLTSASSKFVNYVKGILMLK
jgi:hypothetical protein